MKIGILTQSLCNNYGGLLQNYALQQVLMRAGAEVETINWRGGESGMINKLRVPFYRLCKHALSSLHALFPNVVTEPNYTPTEKELAIIRRNTNYFIETYIKHTDDVHSREGFALQAAKGGYDIYVVGSDQCWRPCYNVFITSMFLDFVQDKKVKRIAYAASFGTDKWEFAPQLTEKCIPLVKKFNLVTVREDSGVSLCKKKFGVDAVRVLDPTMLLSKEDYIHLIEKEKEPKAGGTLFNYILDPDVGKTAFVEKVADAKGMTLFQVLPKHQEERRTREDVKKNIEDCVFPAVTAWLRAFMDAEMTIVDSFHGVVFSIIFNKPFWVIGNVGRGMSRFTSLLKMFKLEDRLLCADHLENVEYSKPIDWIEVNRILDENRSMSKRLLLNEVR